MNPNRITPALLAFALAALPLVRAESDPFQEDSYEPSIILVQLEFIEVTREQFTGLMSVPRTTTDDTDLRQRLAALVDKGQAQIVETMACSTRDGARATTESVDEFIYPTDYDPPEIMPSTHVTKDGEKVPAKAPEAIGPAAIAYETRNLGSTLDVEPSLDPDLPLVDLTIYCDIVHHTGNTVWAEWNDKHGSSPVQMPDFYTLRFRTSVTAKPGAPLLASALTPHDAEGRPDLSRKWLVFVRADVIQSKSSTQK